MRSGSTCINKNVQLIIGARLPMSVVHFRCCFF